MYPKFKVRCFNYLDSFPNNDDKTYSPRFPNPYHLKNQII